ncbi:S24 family peptidase [Sphingomonas sp. PAMC 26605]|uniref:S24 family peptidase n=1 Tax=Sphingomonas sp. PAMC 26605 TaxID=1112214 RepID=UPI0002FD8378|nr:S24 family peptidase [Sphingomonas sp. PAMC 26605]
MSKVARMEPPDPRARLAALIDAHGVGYAALSRMLRRNDAYLQQYVRRGTPRDLAERDRALLAAYFRVDPVELGGLAAPRLAPIRRLDVEVSAGPGTLGADVPEEGAMLLDPRLLDSLRLDAEHAAMLRARGDSMLPTIADGDQIVIDERDMRVGATPAIFVLRLDGVLLVKRVSKAADGMRIASDNPAYPPMTTAAAEIIGRVVWLSRALR